MDQTIRFHADDRVTKALDELTIGQGKFAKSSTIRNLILGAATILGGEGSDMLQSQVPFKASADFSDNMNKVLVKEGIKNRSRFIRYLIRKGIQSPKLLKEFKEWEKEYVDIL